jgi:hypothetical protein
LLAGALVVLFAVFRRIKAGDEGEAKKEDPGQASAKASKGELGEEERVLEDRLKRELDEAP